MLDLIDDGAPISMIPTVHLLATVVNTYLTRNHISWPGFITSMKGFLYMQNNMYQEAGQFLQSAISQYEESIGPNHLLTIETQVYYATCTHFADIYGALKVLECAQRKLDTMLYNNHFLSAKLSYQRALLYQELGKEEEAKKYILDTRRKIHSYGGIDHPWAADLMYNNILKADAGSTRKSYPKSGGYDDIYSKLINREAEESKVFAVETEVEPFIQQWKEKAK